MTFTKGDAEAAREEAVVLREEVDRVKNHLVTVERDHRTTYLEVELEKLRELEELRKEFDQEQRRMREAHERDVDEAREWKRDMIAERSRLRDCVEQLTQQLEVLQGP